MPKNRAPKAKTFQELVLRLQDFWAARGCIIAQPFDIEKGAGTYNHNTFLRALGPEPWRVAYVEPSRRPTDGRYGENPNRLYRHHQFQVLLKPSPKNIQEIYLESMRAIGIHPEEHDIRFVEDNWESPTLGAWGLGWEVWVDGMELTQFTYFQQCGGIECRPVSAELTLGLERIAMYLQGVDNVFDLEFAPGVSYREMFHLDEVQYSKFTFEHLDVERYGKLYEICEAEAKRLLALELVMPGYDHLLKAAHAFNCLDASGAIGVTERQGYILRIRNLAKVCAEGYLALRERLGHPLLRTGDETSVATARPRAPSVVPSGHAMTHELFVEIGTEEIPAFDVTPAVRALAASIASGLAELRLTHGAPEVFMTPRRLAVVFPDVPDRQADVSREVMGPPAKAAFRDGEPTPAAIGFARGQGIDVAALCRKETERGEYVYACVEERGKSTRSLLGAVIEKAIQNIPFKRSMRWGSEEAAFIRPIQWMVALYGGETVPARFADVVSSAESFGHRFMSPEAFSVSDSIQYVAQLERRFVFVDRERRRAMIVDGARRAAEKVGGRVCSSERLLDEVTQLVEYPVALLGWFDARFLEIPREVLISEMEHHQRYFPVEDKDGCLLPNFVVIANTEVENPTVSLDGYRRVLSARFEDGAFFFQEDCKTKLFDRVERLGGVTFHRALGTIREKVDRVVRLSLSLATRLAGTRGVPRALANANIPSDLFALARGPRAKDEAGAFVWDLARAGYLAKADLTTRMVFEFPELQGVMGAYYARASDESAAVAAAIEDHYRPKTSEDGTPTSLLGAILGVADRLDSIVGIFSTGNGPTGTADPLGLRRAVVAIVAILRAWNWQVSLRELTAAAIACLEGKRTKDVSVVEHEVLEFVRTRLLGVMGREGVATDVAEAVLSAGFDDIVDVCARGKALEAVRANRELAPVFVTFKRVANILKGQTVGAVDEARLSHDAERALYRKAREVATNVADLRKRGDYPGAIACTGAVGPVVDAFFDAVMVMDDDLEVRATRLAVVASAHAIFAPIADFSKLS